MRLNQPAFACLCERVWRLRAWWRVVRRFAFGWGSMVMAAVSSTGVADRILVVVTPELASRKRRPSVSGA
jgi:hypothetical protein